MSDSYFNQYVKKLILLIFSILFLQKNKKKKNHISVLFDFYFYK